MSLQLSFERSIFFRGVGKIEWSESVNDITIIEPMIKLLLRSVNLLRSRLDDFYRLGYYLEREKKKKKNAEVDRIRSTS